MLVTENIGKRLFVLLSANKRLNRINKSQILDFIAFYKMSQRFLIWDCILYYIILLIVLCVFIHPYIEVWTAHLKGALVGICSWNHINFFYILHNVVDCSVFITFTLRKNSECWHLKHHKQFTASAHVIVAYLNVFFFFFGFFQEHIQINQTTWDAYHPLMC